VSGSSSYTTPRKLKKRRCMFQKLPLNSAIPGVADEKNVDVSKRVMLGASRLSLRCSAQSRGATVTNETYDILIKLHSANSARTVYEQALELPLDDLYYVGGQLQGLIRHAECILASDGQTLADYVCNALAFRVAEAKSFRRYIITRIRRGA
jgi:hypothetical protein